MNNQAGDLVPTLLAQVLKREIHILEPIAASTNYRTKITLPPSRSDLPAVTDQQGGAPIYLLYTGQNHYSYLQKIEAGHSENHSESVSSIDSDDRHAAQQLLELNRASDSLENYRQSKKGRLAPKEEPPLSESLRCPQPLPTPAIDRGQHFYFSSTMNLSRAQTYTDLSGVQVATRTRIPVAIIPSADITKMGLRPIIQGPDNPNQPHPEIPQPVTLNSKARVRSNYPSTPALKKALENINTLLASPKKRQNYECTAFALSNIKPEHIPKPPNLLEDSQDQATSAIDSSAHPTVGMRGVVAQKVLPMGSAVQYSAQYLSQAQWLELTDILTERLSVEVSLSTEQAEQEARRLLLSYSWKGVRFKKQKYELSAFGAGNIAAMINHDPQLANMGVAYLPTLDQTGKTGPHIVVYFALREIAKGEQLLVDYGPFYEFDPPIEGNLDREATAEESVLNQSLLQLSQVKEESIADILSPVSDQPAIEKSEVRMSEIAFKLWKKYQQPPEDYESFFAKRKRNLKVHVRKVLTKHHLPIPEWALAKSDYVPKHIKLVSTLPEKYQQPPADYHKASVN